MYFSKAINIVDIYTVELKFPTAGSIDTKHPPPKQPPCFVLS